MSRAPDGSMVVDRREGQRLTVGARISLWSDSLRRPAHLRNLSRFGAFVCCDPAPQIGETVHLVIESERGPRTLASGLVIYALDEDSAARLDARPGVGIRFHAPLACDVQVTTSVARVRPPRTPSRPPKIQQDPTRRIIPPVLSELRGACRAVEEAAPRFAGELAEVGVPYLLAMVERTRRTCRLKLTCGLESATIDLADGKIVTARLSSRAITADEVVSMVMRWEEGTFSMAPPEPRTRATATKTIAEHLVEHERGRTPTPRVC